MPLSHFWCTSCLLAWVIARKWVQLYATWCSEWLLYSLGFGSNWPLSPFDGFNCVFSKLLNECNWLWLPWSPKSRDIFQSHRNQLKENEWQIVLRMTALHFISVTSPPSSESLTADSNSSFHSPVQTMITSMATSKEANRAELLWAHRDVMCH